MAETLLARATALASPPEGERVVLNPDTIRALYNDARELAVAYLDQLQAAHGLGAPETAWGWRFASMPEHVVIAADSEAEARRYAEAYGALAVCRTVRVGQWHEVAP